MSVKKSAKKTARGKTWKAGAEKNVPREKIIEKERKKQAKEEKGEPITGKKEEKKSATVGARSAGQSRDPDGKKNAKEEKNEVKTAKGEEKVPQKTALKKFEPVKLSPHEALEAYKIVLHPMITEKAINLIESENKLVFVVKKNANKGEIRKAVEGLYGIKVDSVNIVNDSKSRKKAFVKISTQFNAGEIATRLGVL
ncbi:MAG: 50S ribosomal protein L23 [Candidatus Diapherotrites archaeon]|nr:50S ribosomal protein L23 [Candidatus Diapherotrites archaeon]